MVRGDADSMRSYSSSLGSDSYRSGHSSGSGSFRSDPLSGRSSRSGSSSAHLSLASDPMSAAASAKEVELLLASGDLSRLRRNVLVLVSSPYFNNFMLFVILLNTIVLTMQTVRQTQMSYGWFMSIFDNVFLAIYVVEFVLKIYAFRLRYFLSGWNWLDFIIVSTSVILFLFQTYIHILLNVNTQIFRLLRLLRTVRAVRSLRVLRTINFLKSLQIIVSTILKSIPALASISLLTSILIYIFTVIACALYGDVDPFRFGSLARAAFRVFGLISMDNWGEIWYDNKDQAPSLFVFLIIYLILANFIFLNLFVAVILTNLEAVQDKLALTRYRRLKKKRAAKDAIEKETQQAVQTSPQEEDYERMLRDLAQKDVISNFVRDGTNKERSPRETELITRYLMLLASIENNSFRQEKQKKILDDLVELFKLQSVEKGEMQV